MVRLNAFGWNYIGVGLVVVGLVGGAPGAIAQPTPAESLELDPEIIENSPVLQRWLEEIPDLEEEIRHDPSFRSRLRMGYSQFSDEGGGYYLGVEDLFLGETGLTLSGDVQGSFSGDRQAYGVDLRYYTLPLGSYVNLAPVVGYRSVMGAAQDGENLEGAVVGVHLMVALSRTGAADLSLSQRWVNPGGEDELSVTNLSVGYAIAPRVRLSSDWQLQHHPSTQRRFGLAVEWLF